MCVWEKVFLSGPEGFRTINHPWLACGCRKVRRKCRNRSVILERCSCLNLACLYRVPAGVGLVQFARKFRKVFGEMGPVVYFISFRYPCRLRSVPCWKCANFANVGVNNILMSNGFFFMNGGRAKDIIVSRFQIFLRSIHRILRFIQNTFLSQMY